MADPFLVFRDVMERHGVSCTPQEFQKAVNIYFHEYEARVYDKIHREMWESLPREFELLAGDVMRALPAPKGPMRMLDIGCGTGLSSDLLLRTKLGGLVGELDLVDTSEEMLKRARRRAEGWRARARFHHGMVETLPDAGPYGLILTCSVLHHIPLLEPFLRMVEGMLRPGGYFLHFQDPNGDAFEDADRLRRVEELKRREEAGRGSWTAKLARRAHGVARRLGWEEDFMEPVNRALMDRGVIQTPMTDDEIWTVTDIHEYTGEGISLNRMRGWLTGCELVTSRSYAYFGKMASNLPAELRAEERRLSEAGAQNGSILCAAWRKRE